MIVTFVFGVIAGWIAAGAEERLEPLMADYLPGETPKPVERRAIALSVCLFVAAILSALAGGGGAIALTLGGVLGVLGPRLYAKFRTMRAPDYDS